MTRTQLGDPVDDGGGRDRRLAEIGEHSQRIAGADRRRHVGHNRRETDRHDRTKVTTGGLEFRPSDQIVRADRAMPADREQHNARDDRRPGCAVDPEPETEDEQGIEKGGGDPR